MITVRRISPDEATLLKNMRLSALEESPNAFGSTLRRASRRSDGSWHAQVDSVSTGNDRATFVAFDQDTPVGTVSLHREEDAKEQGEVLQVWVEPSYRGTDVSKNLIKELFDWASENNFAKVKTWVSVSNERAISYYEKNGFELTPEIEAMVSQSPQTIQLMVKEIGATQSAPAKAATQA